MLPRVHYLVVSFANMLPSMNIMLQRSQSIHSIESSIQKKKCSTFRNLSYIEAASIPYVGLTAWNALIDTAKIQKGQNVLILGGAGGIGMYI
jgi:NADPH:quinone reductase-like Zn-dependent oxidoreductase